MKTAEGVVEADFYTIAEIAAMIGVSKVTVYGMVANGKLPAVRVGGEGVLKVPKSAYDRWLEMVSEQAMESLSKNEAEGE